ncbi:virulence factor SrfB [Magnetospirillum molischianum]|uniref:Predicted virulence protein SrfB n=1 Tax=Magnetospirillum molischianum DSM 120 TaxID=1150626 RepID=H8FWR1_MAGML|nr:virulence factor SrfB [Magnetospirillum molischianum]CCG42799.1 Predicted virulence protein SrfB [Magnetospirillum molischianum DSM 120]
MLAQLIEFGEDATLIMRTGVQFMDFGLTLDLRKEMPGQFNLGLGETVARLAYDEASGKTFLPGSRESAQVHLEATMEDSVKLLEDLWLPVPFLRQHSSVFVAGPTNWARARLISLAPGQSDEQGNTHRLVLSFDTNIAEGDIEGAAYLAPTLSDITGGARFALAWQGQDMGWFLEQSWVSNWLGEVFRDRAQAKLRLSPEDIEKQERKFRAHKAHYLNLLALIGSKLRLPKIKILSNRQGDLQKPIQVDLILDVGNSRTCGILIEDHPQETDGMSHRYAMELRDLTRPHQVYADPFESRIEFAEAVFGKVDQSCHSGRNDAFLWPTIARVGPEATRLAARRRGTEGATGLSSPKRYLWDEDRYEPGWRFNDAFNKSESEPHATAQPFGALINDVGEALFTLSPEDRYQVFMPHYSRSSLMTFMLAEVLVQALGQCNSPGQRMKQSHANTARQLRSVILTVPPSMPKAERQVFEERMRQAIGLVWKSLGWHPAEDSIDGDGRELAWPPLPTYKTQWDEATAAQAVYLYSQAVNHFGGRPNEFFQVMRRPRAGDDQKTLTVASIDIGGGTTDLVVTDYVLDDGRGANVYINPRQRFHDGFKVAGDDIVLQVIQKMVVPAITTALKEAGLSDPGPLLSKLMGAEAGIVQHMVLRQQLSLQVFYPLALRILKEYENYDPASGATPLAANIGDLIPSGDRPSEEVLAFFAQGVRGVLGAQAPTFDLLSVRLPIDLGRLHKLFLEDEFEISKTIRALCEVVYLYDCDVLLISGRPSQLPGIQALFRALLPLPPDRIVPLHNFRTGSWYPFHRQERIDDPKTTAAVGAMLCVLGQGRVPNFFFRSNAFRIQSTVRKIGLLDQNMTIKDSDVYYSDVDLDDDLYELPETPFEMRGRMILGFRQLSSARWGASPLYMLDFSADNSRARDELYGRDSEKSEQGNVLSVTLKRTRRLGPPGPDGKPIYRETFAVARVATNEGGMVSPSALRIRLNTLNSAGIGENSYWLDTGSIVR